MKKLINRNVAVAAAMTISLIAAAALGDDEDRTQQPNRYLATNLVSDLSGVAPNTDPVLRNAWGIAFSPAASPFWVADAT
jgi:hypothetical protein